MSDLLSIIRRHRETFYDYNTEKPTLVWPRNTAIVLFSFLVVLVFDGVSVDAISALLTVQSILIGFGFSVLFFLVSADDKRPQEGASIESKLTAAKLEKLSRELFYNISYFNIVATCSVVVALLLLVPHVDSSVIDRVVKLVPGLDVVPANRKASLEHTVFWISEFGNFVLVVLFVESITTFLRTVGRVNFLFEKRLKQAEVKK
jgi:hypothetical protein